MLGGGRLAALTIADAIHWMRHGELFAAARPLLRPGGAIALVANGAALWRQDSHWSHALRKALERWFATTLDAGVDADRRRKYAAALTAAGYTDVTQTAVSYRAEIDLDCLIGTIFTTMPADAVPAPARRADLAEHIRLALAPQTRFTEQVTVTAITGRPEPSDP